MNIKLTGFNNRIYPKEVIDDLIKRSDEKMLYGELGHGIDNDVHISNISHLIENVEVYDDGIYGDMRILNTEMGGILNNFGDYVIGVSERSIGDVDSTTGIVTVSKIIAYDAIVDTSKSRLLELRKKKIAKIKNNITRNDNK